MIGELHVTFIFDTPQLAKIGWERVTKRCRALSVNRWAIDNTDVRTARAVTILTEEEHREQFERAKRLLANGREIPTPPWILDTLRSKRTRFSDSAPYKDVRRVIRDPLGRAITRDGIDIGRVRRPQG